MNNKKNEPSNWIDVNKYLCPGIYKLECLPEKRAYFADSMEVPYDLGKLYTDLELGTCENQQLLQDYQEYGIDNFSFYIIVSGFEYSDEKKRKQALEDAKKSWEGELY